MTKKKVTTRRPASSKPKPLTYDEIARPAEAVAYDLIDAPQTLTTLLLLFDEISTRPTEQAESVANVTLEKLFAITIHADRACQELMTAERAKLQGGAR